VKYLFDANVLCEPTRPRPDDRAVAWLRAHESDLVVDAVVLGEVLAGVLGLPPGRRRRRLEEWFESLAATVVCLPWDAAAARAWARLIVELRRKGRTMPLLDGMVAASALARGLTVATRNTRDFAHAGVRLVDPFA
jgi:toxin FitB